MHMHMRLGVAAERAGRARGSVLDALAHDGAQHLHRRRRTGKAEAAEDAGVRLDKILRGKDRARRVTECLGWVGGYPGARCS